jgi:hypothetical protein
MTSANHFSQYYLLRKEIAPTVSLLDDPQMLGLDNMDRQQAIISNWQAGVGMAVYSQPSFMEPLPCQAIRFDNISSNKDPFILKAQSKDGFRQFHLTKK